MKKSIKKSSRRKWVVGGVAFFGSIALLTTGFATWVVGVQQKQAEGDINVTVNTTTNESIKLEAELSGGDAAITLAETVAKTDGKIINEKEPVNNALDITFKTLKITMGKNATKPNGLKMTIDTSANKNQQIIATKYEFSDHSGESGLTYIAAPESIVLDTTAETGTVTETTEGQNIVWEITNKTFTFKWGTYFDNVSPCNYYNSFFSNSEPTQADVDAVTNEMSAMHAAFNAPNSNTITLTLELTFSNNEGEESE